MGSRHLYLARHGAANVFGELTDVGLRQADALGQRLSRVPIGLIWHSPLPRAAAFATAIQKHLPQAQCDEATELSDNIPFVPMADRRPGSWAGFFDGYDDITAAAARRTADALTERFATPPPAGATDSHELLVSHEYPIAWLIRDALDAPPERWLGLASANAALTVISYRHNDFPSLLMFNDMSHLTAELRWTGFPAAVRP